MSKGRFVGVGVDTYDHGHRPRAGRCWFTGRTVEVDRVVAWVRSGRPGAYVVTGSAGTGKSAIVGRVVGLADPDERARLLARSPLEHADPGERSVHAHVHAPGLTADRAAELLAGQLVRRGVLPPQDEPHTAAGFVGRVRRAVRAGAAPPVVVIDGLDGAGDQAFGLAEDLVSRLARHAVVVVATREVPRGDGRLPLVATLAPGDVIDLDDPAVQERGRADLSRYLVARLTGVDDRMDPMLIAVHVAAGASMTDDRPFLLATLVTDQLRAVPVDTSEPGWLTRISGSAEEALDTDIARVAEPRSPDEPAGATPSGVAVARRLLTALTWAFGSGLPEEEWLTVANALPAEPPDAEPHTAEPCERDDLSRVLDRLGRYVVRDGEAGVAVYRLAHQSLADHLRAPHRASYGQPFDPRALPVATALLTRYAALLDGGLEPAEPAYLWRYAWRHVAAAGPAALDALRALAGDHAALMPDVARTALHLANQFGQRGRRTEAAASAEEAVGLYRGLVEVNVAFRPDLAGGLTTLGICYGEVGRRGEAVAPVEEAVGLYRRLAGANDAFGPDLARALTTLGNRYCEVGRRGEAVDRVEEAVGLYRGLVEVNAAFRPDLAGVLTTLGICYGEVGRRGEAVAPAEEAVGLYRGLVEVDEEFVPDLAAALNNLGAFYCEVGGRGEAVAPTEEAVGLYRRLVEMNAAFRPDLAGVLANLGACYGEVGRRGEAVAPAEEAVGLYRGLVEVDEEFVPDLAAALNNLGAFYCEVGGRGEAVAPTEEAVGLYRGLVEVNEVFVPDLAAALNNLSGLCAQAGEPDRAEAAWRVTFATVSGDAAAFLRAARATAVVGHPDAARGPVDPSQPAGDDRDLTRAPHTEARQHRDAGPVDAAGVDAARADGAWSGHPGEPAPARPLVSAALLPVAQGWIATASYTDERDHLAAHAELLDPAADDAIAEAVLEVSEEEAERYASLREAARLGGVEAAYRPLLLTVLAREFVQADPADQRVLIAERRDDLLSDTVRAVLGGLAGRDDTGALLRAGALLDLAALDEHGPVLDALAEPAGFSGLLGALAARPDPTALRTAAVVAYTATATQAERATGGFFLAVAAAVRGDREQAEKLLAHARTLDPDRSAAWIGTLAELGQVHPAVLPLITALVRPPAVAEPSGED